MSPLTTAKVALALSAAVLFALSIRTENQALRWAAMGMLAVAVLLRFFDRKRRGQ